jgi:hypothetical protein
LRRSAAADTRAARGTPDKCQLREPSQRKAHRRIATRRGPLKAVVAVEHAMLVAIWHMINDPAPYRDPGADYYTRLNPDKIKNRAIDQLTAIGYAVTLTPRPLTGPQRQ